MKKTKSEKCGVLYSDSKGNTGATCANIKPCLSKHKIRDDGCQHEFRYSHIEYPPMGTYTAIPLNKEVVICPKCGELKKTIVF